MILGVKDESDLGLLISNEEEMQISKAFMEGSEAKTVALSLVQRWNDTMTSWKQGRFEALPYENQISFSRLKGLMEKVVRINDYAINQGYGNYLEMFQNSYLLYKKETSTSREKGGVCAKVSIRLNQQATLTREAFLASLEITNEDESKMTSLNVQIKITKTGGGGSLENEKFSVPNATKEGISDSSIWPGSKGSLKWRIVPYSEAAPKVSTAYFIGGTLSYNISGQAITIELTPARILVQPDPRLSIHYFWQKIVWSDDPFTKEIEPSLPFSVIAAIRNKGYGSAYGLTMSSGQPEIVENEKGLLVDFKLIGMKVDGGSFQPTLEVNIGTLKPNSTSIIDWQMTASLYGVFKNFTATFTNTNPNGDPKLSLIEQFSVHELFQVVRKPGLVRDFYLTKDSSNSSIEYPEHLFDSQNLGKEKVSAIVPMAYSVDMNQKIIRASIEVNIPANTNIVYLKFPTDLRIDIHEMESFTRTDGSNTTVTLPNENAWLASYNYKSKFLDGHLIDFLRLDQSGRKYTYTLTAKPKGSTVTTTTTRRTTVLDTSPATSVDNTTAATTALPLSSIPSENASSAASTTGEPTTPTAITNKATSESTTGTTKTYKETTMATIYNTSTTIQTS